MKCLTCENISITFDPFLTLALPIARPFKLTVRFIPYDYFVEKPMIGGGSTVAKNPIMTYNIPLNKDSKIEDLKRITGELAGLPGPQQGTRLVIATYKNTSSRLTRKYQQLQSCYDIDPSSNEDLVAYELRVDELQRRERPEDFKAIELVFMKQTKNSSGAKIPGNISADAIGLVLPRMEMLEVNMTILEVKRYIYNKVKHIYPQEHPIHKEET